MFERQRIFRFWFGFEPVVVFFKPETVEVSHKSNIETIFVVIILRKILKLISLEKEE